jgi:hypothetical protein
MTEIAARAYWGVPEDVPLASKFLSFSLAGSKPAMRAF